MRSFNDKPLREESCPQPPPPPPRTHPTYPTQGLVSRTLFTKASSSACSCGCGLIRYLTNWAVNQTLGSPWSRVSLSARSAGMARGRYGGRGLTTSIMGRFSTWVSSVPAGRGREGVRERDGHGWSGLSLDKTQHKHKTRSLLSQKDVTK